MARSFVSGAVSITMTEQRAPTSRAAKRDALRGVAGADGPDAVPEFVGGQLTDGVVRRRES